MKLTFGKKLTLKVDREIINISATHDRTRAQRDQHKKLVEELKIRKENDSSADLVIRNNRIVSSFQDAASGTKSTWANIVKSLN